MLKKGNAYLEVMRWPQYNRGLFEWKVVEGMGMVLRENFEPVAKFFRPSTS